MRRWRSDPKPVSTAMPHTCLHLHRATPSGTARHRESGRSVSVTHGNTTVKLSSHPNPNSGTLCANVKIFTPLPCPSPHKVKHNLNRSRDGESLLHFLCMRWLLAGPAMLGRPPPRPYREELELDRLRCRRRPGDRERVRLRTGDRLRGDRDLLLIRGGVLRHMGGGGGIRRGGVMRRGSGRGRGASTAVAVTSCPSI